MGALPEHIVRQFGVIDPAWPRASLAALCVALWVVELALAGGRRPLAPSAQRWLWGALAVASVLMHHARTDLVIPAAFTYHRWDFYHHHLAARFERELAYDGLYVCAAAAVAESAAGASDVGRSPIRDLETGRLIVPADEPERLAVCKARFSAERWEAFRADVAFFERAMRGGLWRDAQQSCGSLMTPTQVALAKLVASGPASDARFTLVAGIDPVLELLTLGLVAWAFGWRTMCVFTIVWALQALGPNEWMGGAMLRQPRLVALVASICLVRRGRQIAAGAALSIASLLWALPVFYFMGPLALAVRSSITTRALGRSNGRFLAGAAGGLVLALAATQLGATGATWGGWAHQLTIMPRTPVANEVGLPTALSFDRSQRSPTRDDPHGSYAELSRSRAEVLARRSVALRAMQVAMVGLAVGASLVSGSLWAAMALGAVPAFTLVSVPCYLAVHVVCVALLTRRRRWLEGPLLLFSLGSQLCLVCFEWHLERYAAMSALTIVVMALAPTALASPRSPR